MTTATSTIQELANREYQYGFVTDIEAETVPRGPERGHRPPDLGQEERAGLAARVAAQGYRHWLTMEEPRWWPNLHIAPIDYQDIIYYSAPKPKKKLTSLDEVDPGAARAPSRSSASRWTSRSA